MKVFILQQQESLAKMINLIGGKNLPGLQMAVRKAANIVLRTWIEKIGQADTKEGWKRRYKQDVNIDRQIDPLKVSVSASGLFMNLVEEGVKRFSIKDGLLNGPHARINKKGEPYNIVFFRAGTPKAHSISPMPVGIYKVAKKLDKKDVEKRYRVIGVGGKTPLMKGGNLQERTKTKTKQLKRKDKYGGLVKMGSLGHTQYGTFRVVSKNSKGWIHPGVPAAPVFPKLEDAVHKKVKKLLQEGLLKDIESGINFLEGKGY